MNLVLRAVIANKWAKTALNAHIHALIGNNSEKLVNEAGRVFFVVLGAIRADKIGVIDPDEPDVRILRGAVNAVYDQAGEPVIDALRRASIVSGLLAAERLAALLDRRLLVDAACNLDAVLKRRHVLMSDFEGLTA